MKPKEKIIQYLQKKKTAKSSELTQFLGISRQALNRHIKALITEGKVIKEGETKGVVYRLAKYRKKHIRKFQKNYPLKGLEEHIVFKRIEILLNLRRETKDNVSNIFQYAFTEILNNAIEHSLSEKCAVEVNLDNYYCNFKIRDYGIGIFYSIHKKFNLRDEMETVGELLKGKRTTLPQRHTGEGVFFTSKSGDIVSFRSHKINLIFDNIKKDIFVEEKKFIKGTEVIFSIAKNSKKRLEDIFNFYAPEEFGYKFEKTKVKVKLFQERYLSRSEARRLLFGLEKFKEIILDFKDVKTIGQGFADEIFRVFTKGHPEIRIKIENLSPSLKGILKHVVDNKSFI